MSRSYNSGPGLPSDNFVPVVEFEIAVGFVVIVLVAAVVAAKLVLDYDGFACECRQIMLLPMRRSPHLFRHSLQ